MRNRECSHLPTSFSSCNPFRVTGRGLQEQCYRKRVTGKGLQEQGYGGKGLQEAKRVAGKGYTKGVAGKGCRKELHEEGYRKKLQEEGLQEAKRVAGRGCVSGVTHATRSRNPFLVVWSHHVPWRPIGTHLTTANHHCFLCTLSPYSPDCLHTI